MKLKTVTKIIAIFCCFCLFATSLTIVNQPVSAETLAELKQQLAEKEAAVKKAKAEKASKEKIKAALDEQIRAAQALIDNCNDKIADFNKQISDKQKEIDSFNENIKGEKELFKKRIRQIEMSNVESDIHFLLGSTNSTDYMTLSKLSENIAARDTELINKIIEAVKKIEEEQSKIKGLLGEQAEVKKELDEQKKKLNGQIAEVNSIIKDLNRDIAADQADMNNISNKIDSMSSSNSSNITFDGGNFLWPVAGHYYISAGWQSNDSVHKGTHKGIDIAGGGIAGKPVRAAANGYVYIVNNSCTHNYGKQKSCGCGGGYGNYVAIDHGKFDGTSYKTLYAHMKKTIVKNGQYVKRGETIGYVGTTGWSTGNHLHFEVIVNGVKKNPKNYSYER